MQIGGDFRSATVHKWLRLSSPEERFQKATCHASVKESFL